MAEIENENQDVINDLFQFQTPRKLRDDSWNVHKIAEDRGTLSLFLNYHLSQLEMLNPTMFIYLNAQQRRRQKEKLEFVQQLIDYQYLLDVKERQRKNINRYEELRRQIKAHIDCLNNPQKTIEEKAKSQGLDEESQHTIKYMGLYLFAPLLKNIMTAIVDGVWEKAVEAEHEKLDTCISIMNAINERRLYWVWAGGGLLSSLLQLLPTDFFNYNQAQAGIAAPSPITGYMSWILYYLRFGINLLLVIDYTIHGSEATWQERFKTVWEDRKYQLINDSVWGLANMACFLWLTGTGWAGFSGNILTALLLTMDLAISVWRYQQEAAANENQIALLRKRYEELKENYSNARDENEKEALREKVWEAEKLLMETELNWKYKKFSLLNDIGYAGSLLFAFCIACCFFFPPMAAVGLTFLWITFVGSALCFVMNATFAAFAGGIEIAKTEAFKQLAEKQIQQLLERLDETKEPDTQFALFLEMKGLAAKSAYQEEMIHFQKIKLARSVLIDALIPFLVISSFLFLPLGAGLGALATGLAVIVISHVVLSKLEPKWDSSRLPAITQELQDEYEVLINIPNEDNTKRLEFLTRMPTVYQQSMFNKPPEPSATGLLSVPLKQ